MIPPADQHKVGHREIFSRNREAGAEKGGLDVGFRVLAHILRTLELATGVRTRHEAPTTSIGGARRGGCPAGRTSARMTSTSAHPLRMWVEGRSGCGTRTGGVESHLARAPPGTHPHMHLGMMRLGDTTDLTHFHPPVHEAAAAKGQV